MSRRLPLPLLLGVLLAAAPLAAQEEVQLKSGDARKLSKPYGDWVEALVEGKSADAAEAKTELVEAVESVQKKFKDRAVLGLIRDLEVMFDEGRDYETGGSWVNKGRASTFPLAGASFIVRVPSRYNPKKQNYPMMLLLDAEATEESIDALPEEMSDGWIIVAPQLAGEDADTVVDRGVQVRMLASFAQSSIRYRIDRNRLFAVAKGAVGIQAASDVVASFPHFFAGFAVIGGEPAPRRGAENIDLLAIETNLDDVAAAAAWAAGCEPRDVYPTEYSFVLTREWAGRGFWVHATEFDLPQGDDEPSSR
jgi:hypothetical protein